MRLASINCTVATVESSRSKKYFCRKEQKKKKKKKKKKEENEVPGIVLAGKFSFHFHLSSFQGPEKLPLPQMGTWPKQVPATI